MLEQRLRAKVLTDNRRNTRRGHVAVRFVAARDVGPEGTSLQTCCDSIPQNMDTIPPETVQLGVLRHYGRPNINNSPRGGYIEQRIAEVFGRAGHFLGWTGTTMRLGILSMFHDAGLR